MAQLFFLLTLAVSTIAGRRRFVDLTHALDTNAVYWPGSPSFKFNILSRQQLDSFWYESNNFSTAEHGGTHLDSPSHFSRNKWRLHEIPLNNLIGPGVVIDISARAEQDPDTQVEIDDLLQWEEKHGQIPEGAIVLMNSGWDKYWPNKTAVFGSSTPNDSSTFHFPGFSPSTARWIIDNRKYINAIGVDTPSIDFGRSRDFQTHVTVFGANIVGLENVANLDKVPVTGATVFAIPVKIRDGSGGPLRIFAMLNDVNRAGISQPEILCMVVTFIALLLI